MTAMIESLRASVGAYLPELGTQEDMERTAWRLEAFAVQARSREGNPGWQGGRAEDGMWTASDLPSRSDDPGGSSPDPQCGRWFRLLAVAWSGEFRERLRQTECLAEPGQAEQEILDHLTDLIGSQVLRALLDALTRQRDAGKLTGDTSEERFLSFREWLVSSQGRASLAADYPQTLTQAYARVQHFLAHAVEVLDRYERDLDEISRRMPWISTAAKIAQISWGSGDTHNEGRSVAILRLDSGVSIVYKPRDLSSDVAFHRAVSSLVDGGVADLRVLSVVPGRGYGWMEYVAPAEQPVPHGAYFERVGALTALLHVLHATDMHFENVVTDPDGYPVVVDTETLLTPKPRLEEGYAEGAASTIGRRMLNDSVASIGTLPLAVSVPGREGSLDIGATGFTQAQQSPFRSHVLRDPGQDTMHLAFEKRPSPGSNTNPVVAADDATEVIDRRDRIKEGFRAVMAWIQRNTGTFGAQLRGDLHRAPLRYVHAPTIFYTQLLRIAMHPSVSEEPAAKLAVLGRVYLRDAYASGDQVARHELHQLNQGDVPYFIHRAGDTAIRAADGAPIRSRFFEAEAMELLERGLERAEPDAVEQQCRIIDDLFVRLIPNDTSGTNASSALLERPVKHPNAQDTLRAALHATATEIARRAVRSTDPKHPSTWIGPLVTTDDSEQWVPGTLGYDLYGGSAGLALALAGVGSLTADRELLEVSKSVLDPIEEQLTSGALAQEKLSAGAMTGMSGTVWAIATARRISGRPDPERTLRCLAHIADNLPRQRQIEFTTGSVGALAAANALWSHGDIPRDDAGETAMRRIGESVAEQIAAKLPGMKTEAMDPSRTQEPLYTGYAHGLAGMLPHLSTYGSLFSDHRALLVASQIQELMALAFDGTDWTRRPGTEERSWAWCHGAPGMLQSWAELRRHHPAAADGTEGAILRDLTRERGLGNNSTYCHGDLGSLDGLLEAARAEGDHEAAAVLRQSIRDLVEDQLDPDRGTPCDRYSYTDSLMVGRSGKLWSGLRAVDPDQYPSPLCLG